VQSAVGVDYFRAMNIPLLKGAGSPEQDTDKRRWSR
jgi:hypothetical protein